MKLSRTPVLASLATLGLLALPACGDDGDATSSDTDVGTSGDDAGTSMTTTTMTTMTSLDGTGTGPDDTGTATGDTTGEPGGTASVRVIHGAPDAPAVDVYVEGSDDPIITNLAYGETTEYLEVPAGEYNFQVRPAGAPASDDPVFETGTLPVPDGAVVTALAAGLLAGTTADDAFRIIPLVEGFDAPTAGNAIVRVVHAGADAPAVGIDVGADGTVEVETLSRFADTGVAGVELPAGEALQIGIVADGTAVTAFTTPELPEGAELFVVATGLLGDLPREASGFSLLAVGPTGSVGFIRQNPRVYALHASPDAGNVDVCAGATSLLAAVPYGAMAPVQVPPGAYDLSFFAAGLGCDGDPVGTFSTGDLAAGEQYLALATGELTREMGDPDFTLAAYVEQFALDAAAGSGVLRVIHGASAPEVAVGVVTGGQIEDAGVLIPAIAWPDESGELEVPAMSYSIGVAPSDATFPTDPLATFDVPVADGGRGWVIAVGQLAGNPGFTLWSVDTTVSPWTLTDLGG